jgi:hypothetical protein
VRANIVPVIIAALGTINPLNAKLNPICHLLALLGAHHILHVSWIRVKNELDQNLQLFPFHLSAIELLMNTAHSICKVLG